MSIESGSAAGEGILSRIGEGINPITVKEVRQALRGKYFRWTFWCTLAALTLVAVSFLISGRADPEALGMRFFMSVFVCLAIGVHLLVPFVAFVSMGAEWEENTYDLLVLSNLRPRDLVFGKFVSVMVQALLFYATALPFLTFAFLLQDVDLYSIAVVLVGSVAFCSFQIFLALSLSSLTQNKFGRVVLMAVLAALLAGGLGLAIATAGTILFSPGVIRQPQFLAAALGILTALAFVGSFLVAVACARLAHPEENRSTGLRVLTVSTLVLGLTWFAWIYSQFPDDDPLFACGIVVAVLLFWTVLFFNTEPEALGRRVGPRVPKNRLLAALATPFLPGGGRGFLLFCLLAPVWYCLLPFVWDLDPTPSADDLAVSGQASILSMAMACSYLGLLPALFTRFTVRLAGRNILRLAVVLGVLLSWVLPALIGFFINDRAMMNMRHLFSPFHLLEEIADSDIHKVWWMVMAQVVLGGLVLLINIPRMVRGVLEVQRASAEARRRHAQAQ